MADRPPPSSSSDQPQSSSSSSTTTPATTTTTTSRITTTSTTQPPTSTSTSGTTTQATTTSSAFTTTASTFTTSSWSLSTSGTVTFSHLVPSVGTVTNSPGANTSDGGSSVFTPVFWGVTGAILGAIALLAGAICFIRGRVRNKRNDRVYRPGGFGGTVGGGAAAGGAAGAGGRAFQPGLGSAQRPSFTGAAGKGNASAGYAGGVVTLVELSDANPQPPQSPPLHPYGPTPPPTTQPQYGVPVSMPMQGYPSMPPAGGAPEYGAYAYGDPNMSTGMPPKQSGGYDMQPSGGTYDPQAYPMMSSASPVAPAIGGGQDDGVITFAPTMQRDDEYMQQAPPGMEYRMNEHTGQQELHYVDQHHSGGGGAYQQQQQYGAEMNRTGSPLNGNAPGVTRQLRLPGQH